MSWVSVAVAGVSVGTSVYKGLKAKSQDKTAAAEGAALKRPAYQIPTEDIENRNIAAVNATGGLSAAEKQYAGEQRERGLGSSLGALEETGGGPNDFAQLNHIFDDSLKSESALDAQLHMKNIESFTRANQDVATQKSIQWGVNEMQPYESKLKEIQDRRIAAKTNENNAVNEGIGGLTAGATGINSANKFGKAAEPVGGNLGRYSRNFGLADTGGSAGSPADEFPVIDANSFSQGALAGT